MRVLLIGATGYVGRAVSVALLAAGHDVVGLVRAPSRVAALAPGVSPVTGNLEDPASVIGPAREADAVINAGFAANGTDWAASVATERRFHEALIEGLAGTGKILIVTNGTIFLGDSGNGRQDEHVPPAVDHPATIRAESIALVRRADGDALRVVELRLASFVHGHGGSVFIPALLPAARRDGRSIHVGDGAARVSAVHVDAAADAFVRALENDTARGIYHVASDDEPSVLDIARAVGIASGTEVVSVGADEAVRVRDPFTAMFLQTNNRLDSTRIRRELSWSGAGAHPLLWDVAHGSYASNEANPANGVNGAAA